MSVLGRVLDAVWPAHSVTRAALDPTIGYGAHVLPPARAAGPVTISDAVTIPAVYRALSLLTTAAAQLPLNAERAGLVLPDSKTPALVRRPSLDCSRSDFIEQLVMSMAVSGNAFIRKNRAGRDVISLDVLNPHHVTVTRDPKTDAITFGHKGKSYTADEIHHIALFRPPGALRGLGPIQAAQTHMRGTVEMREHMGRWFSDSGQPAGILSSDQELTADQAHRYRNAWNHLDADGQPIEQQTNPSRIRVLGKGTKYQPILISPKDALWLEAQAASTLEIARLFGVPTSLMYAAIEGNSQTYSNVEQEWLAFVRFTLMDYLRKIEEALTALTPAGTTVRFNLEGLLRSDTKTRYDGYNVALTSGFMTVNEVRKIEGLPPLAGGDDLQPTKPAIEGVTPA